MPIIDPQNAIIMLNMDPIMALLRIKSPEQLLHY